MIFFKEIFFLQKNDFFSGIIFYLSSFLGSPFDRPFRRHFPARKEQKILLKGCVSDFIKCSEQKSRKQCLKCNFCPLDGVWVTFFHENVGGGPCLTCKISIYWRKSPDLFHFSVTCPAGKQDIFWIISTQNNTIFFSFPKVKIYLMLVLQPISCISDNFPTPTRSNCQFQRKIKLFQKKIQKSNNLKHVFKK
jgi:hypothetical protein